MADYICEIHAHDETPRRKRPSNLCNILNGNNFGKYFIICSVPVAIRWLRNMNDQNQQLPFVLGSAVVSWSSTDTEASRRNRRNRI